MSVFNCIVITSDEPFGKVWHTQIIYARELSKNHRVIYLAPPGKWRISNLFRRKYKTTRQNGVLVYQYHNPLPAYFNTFNDRVNLKQIKKQLKEWSCANLLLWHFDSFRAGFFTGSFGVPVRRIFHVIDPHMKNPIHDQLAEVADLIVIFNPLLTKHYNRFPSKLLILSQGLEYPVDTGDTKAPEIGKDWKNYFVIVGTFSNYVDFEAILELVKKHRLVIIGKKTSLEPDVEAAFQKMISSPNVRYFSPMSPPEFYPILRKASGGLVVYNETKRRMNDFSVLKFLNYLAASIPVITNTDCLAPQLEGTCIFTFKGLDELEELLNACEAGTIPFDVKKANEYVEQTSVHNQVKRVSERLNAF